MGCLSIQKHGSVVIENNINKKKTDIFLFKKFVLLTLTNPSVKINKEDNIRIREVMRRAAILPLNKRIKEFM